MEDDVACTGEQSKASRNAHLLKEAVDVDVHEPKSWKKRKATAEDLRVRFSGPPSFASEDDALRDKFLKPYPMLEIPAHLDELISEVIERFYAAWDTVVDSKKMQV